MSGSATEENRAFHSYLSARWLRTDPACAELAPAHAHQQVCPIASAGASWSASGPAATAPFLPAELRDRHAGVVQSKGCGWLLVQIGELYKWVESPGQPPLKGAAMAADIMIASPPGDGAGLANAYGGALAQIFPIGWIITVSDSQYLEGQEEPLRPQYRGLSEGWDWYQLRINFYRYWR